MRKVLLGIAVLVAAVLGYGWWHASTHADVWLRVNDVAGKTPNRLWADVHDAKLVIRDAAGRTLAEANLVPPHGLPTYVGTASALNCQSGQPLWYVCWKAQSHWLAQWAPHAATARVMVGRCVVDAVPIDRKVYADWWLWWVPLPHVGGTPIRHHQLTMTLDSARCAAATAP